MDRAQVWQRLVWLLGEEEATCWLHERAAMSEHHGEETAEAAEALAWEQARQLVQRQ